VQLEPLRKVLNSTSNKRNRRFWLYEKISTGFLGLFNKAVHLLRPLAYRKVQKKLLRSVGLGGLGAILYCECIHFFFASFVEFVGNRWAQR
jgi:hypothetical protein